MPAVPLPPQHPRLLVLTCGTNTNRQCSVTKYVALGIRKHLNLDVKLTSVMFGVLSKALTLPSESFHLFVKRGQSFSLGFC